MLEAVLLSVSSCFSPLFSPLVPSGLQALPENRYLLYEYFSSDHCVNVFLLYIFCLLAVFASNFMCHPQMHSAFYIFSSEKNLQDDEIRCETRSQTRRTQVSNRNTFTSIYM